MLLIVEVVLTIIACVRFNQAGKNWLIGLLPLIVVMGLGFCIGVAMGASGQTVTVSTMAPFILFDLGAIGALIYMIVKNKPQKA